MSETVAERNLEHARQLLMTMNEGGSKAVLARMEEFAQPEVEWRGVAAGRTAPGGDIVYQGYEGMKRFWEEIEDVFEHIHFADLKLEAIGDDVVLAFLRVTAIGHGSRFRVEQEMGVVYRFREGRVVSGENFASQADARKSALELAAGAS
jgi:ketosteroid isomerase-like protein